MRLIDADRLKRVLIAFFTGAHLELPHISKVIDFLDNAPAIDAVPVVRCGECKWTIKDIGKYPYCMMNRDINGDCRMVSEYGFCSYGERKGGAKMDEVSE